MPVFIKGNKSVLFIHVPKTGGTSIEQLFLSAGWERRHFLSRLSNQTDKLHNSLLRCSPQHMEATQLRTLFRLDRFNATFMLTRNPIDRFKSEYTMRKLNKPGGSADEISVETWADRHFKKYAEDTYILDNHLRPQVEFMVPGAHIFKLEDGLDQVPMMLNERYSLGLPKAVQHKMDSRKLAGGKSSSDVQVSARLSTHLRAIYQDDFNTFGY